MKTQQDTRIRMVALDNLRAMCAHATGMSHSYQVSKVSRSRVHVTYSNPDGYGNSRPVTAVFPCYPSPWPDDADNPRVLLDPLRVLGDDANGSVYQIIDAMIVGCPTLWRKGPGHPWQTHNAIVRGQVERGETSSAPIPGKPCSVCVKCDIERSL